MRIRPAWTESSVRLGGDVVEVREIVDADAPTLFEMLSDPRVTAYMSPPPPSLDAFRGFISWARSERAQGNGICFGIVPPGLSAAVGVIQLRPQEPSWFTAEWGFAIGAPFWATGAFLDAAQLVAGFAFEQMGVHRLEARAMITNGRGNGALQKIGATPEGQLASAFPQNGTYSPQFLWGLPKDAWRQCTLVRPPFSVTAAQASIAAATRDTARLIRARHPRNAREERPPQYPFFVNES